MAGINLTIEADISTDIYLKNGIQMKNISERIRRRLVNVLAKKRVEINGVRILIPYTAGIEMDATEPWMTKVLKVLLPSNPGTFLDVGVNLGQTLIKVKAIDASREYIGFEPNPTCLCYTKNLIELNGFEECSLVPAALTLSTGLGTLYSIQNSSVDAAATIIKDFRPEHGVARKEYIPLLDLRYNLKLIDGLEKKVGVIKIDVEGAELDVIESIQEIIERDHPAIIIEILPTYTKNHRVERQVRQERLEKTMHSLGYAFYRINSKEAEEVDFEHIGNIGAHDEIDWSDYVLIHESSRQAYEEHFTR